MEIVNFTSPKAPIPEDSLKKRYLYKLSTNLIGLVVGLVTESIIPRGLGPVAYGNFNFLSNFFTQVVSFFDAGTSTAFYTKLSQRPTDAGLLRFYWGFTELLGLTVCLGVGIAFSLGLESWLWPEQTTLFIWLAVLWGLLAWYSERINHIVDAYGLTVKSEIVRIWQKILGLVLILLMFWADRFSLTEFFIYQYVILLFLCVAWWRLLTQSGKALFPKIKLTFQQIKNYGQEFYHYSAPLITFTFFSLFVGVLDRWLLQRFAGSVEQGFFGLSFKIGAICFLFTRAMTPLLLREFSTAFERQDLNQMRYLFQRYIPLLYVVAAFFAVFVAVQAEKVSLIFGGSEFRGASLAIGIMAFYPIHQTYGQLSSSVLFATGQTKLYRNIGLFMLLINLPLTLWLLGPKEWSGLNLGATGLAIEMVLIQFIGVNGQLWFNTRFLQLSFWKLIGHQIYSVALLVGVAWLSVTFIDQMINSTLLGFLVSGFIYTLGVGLVLFLLPSLVFMSRADLTRQLAQLRAIRSL
ncbi:MAG: lipopolysaccharide biosynthesis protein [Anaerolineae bacterium]